MSEKPETIQSLEDDTLDRLQEAIENNDRETCTQIIASLESSSLRRTISNLDRDLWKQLGAMIDPESSAEMVEKLAEAQAIELLEEFSPESAADIIEELPLDLAGDILREMGEDESTDILDEIEDSVELEALRERTSYAWDSAGALMSDQVTCFHEESTVGDVLHQLHDNADVYSDRDVQYLYVVDSKQRLKGVLALRSLVLARRNAAIAKIMIVDPLSVPLATPVREIEAIFLRVPYLGLPVIDENGVLEGVVSRESVREARSEKQKDTYLKSLGIVGGDELRSMPLKLRSMRRLGWLVPNIILNLIAASIIAMFEDTLQAVIALAVFLPIVSDMSGCSGNQAVAVSIRELTLNIIRPGDYLRVVLKEGMLGIVNGAVLGLLLGTVAGLWQGNLYLGLVIGSALAMNTLLSVLLGGMVPLILRKAHADPALASGPILTTCTDMCGFFLVLGMATLALQHIA